MAIHFTPSTPVISDLTLPLRKVEQAGPEQTEIRSTFLPAEWYAQSGVQLTWPHQGTDWANLLHEVESCFISIALEILSHGEELLIVNPDPDRVRVLLEERIPSRLLSQVHLFECPANDTWARDHGFITLMTEAGPQLLDYQFNGWGHKFPSDLDNQICRRLAGIDTSFHPSHEQALPLHGHYASQLDFVLEGGSIESDGRGTILTTSACLLSPNRNPSLSRQQIEERLLRDFHAERILWLDHGYLAGDDTDSHIDTLARFCPNNTIAYVHCTDPTDEHFEALQAMEAQLQTFEALPLPASATLSAVATEQTSPSEGSDSVSSSIASTHSPYRLIPLPLPAPIYDPEDGHRLPATYANFLIINGAVLMPTYGQPENDEQARRQLQKAFPKYDIVPIDCRVLIRQHGSLHCSTMQYPVGVLGERQAPVRLRKG